MGKEKTRKKIDIDRYGKFDRKERAAMIKELESGVYGGKNVEGEDVVVLVENGASMDVLTYQDNGWVRSDEYDETGMHLSESFQGRWR